MALARSRALGRLVPDKTVFFLIDVQDRFRNAIDGFDKMALTSRFLTKASSVMQIPCVATEQYPKALGKTIQELDVSAENIKVFEKTKFSAIVPQVEEHLDALGFSAQAEEKSAVVYGIETHVCVYQTCMDLLEKGWQVHVVADSVSSSKPMNRAVALERLQLAGCHLTTAECVLFDLMRDTKYHKFKEISALVKEQNANLVALESGTALGDVCK